MVNFFNVDCEDFMRSKPDKCYDLAIVDPGYGIGEDWAKTKNSVHYTHRSTYKNDKIPSHEYFSELFRVSENQIIWGGNYFTEFLRPTNAWIIWDKKRDVEKTFMSECEAAWTSFKIPMRIYRHIWDGGKKGIETGITKIHPHQKPLNLYRWTLNKYARENFKLLDTHGGSMSSAIACDIEGYDLDICEIDKDYFDLGVKRFNDHKKQLVLF
jgi:site-specific DNA-methyltransferase (adenine-specific)